MKRGSPGGGASPDSGIDPSRPEAVLAVARRQSRGNENRNPWSRS